MVWLKAVITTIAVMFTTAFPAMSDTSLNIMVEGDSISLGCDSVPLAGWCAGLSGLLDDRSIQHTIAGDVHSGWSCTSLASTFKARFDQIQPDLLILNCGTNDVPNTPAAQDAMGTAWRTMVEYAHAHGALVLPVFVQYSNPEINAKNGRAWLVSGEANANDVIYRNRQYYVNYPGWFAGLADFQQVPGNWDFLNGGTDGIHPNPTGQRAYAAIVYRALKDTYGWPDTVPTPCSMWGHRDIYDPPPYIPCSMTG